MTGDFSFQAVLSSFSLGQTCAVSTLGASTAETRFSYRPRRFDRLCKQQATSPWHYTQTKDGLLKLRPRETFDCYA